MRKILVLRGVAWWNRWNKKKRKRKEEEEGKKERNHWNSSSGGVMCVQCIVACGPLNSSIFFMFLEAISSILIHPCSVWWWILSGRGYVCAMHDGWTFQFSFELISHKKQINILPFSLEVLSDFAWCKISRMEGYYA